WIAEAAAVRQDQIGLQLGQPVVGNARLREQAEAGVDAVDRAASGDDSADILRRRVDRRPGVAMQRYRRAAPDCAKIGEGDDAGGENDRSPSPLWGGDGVGVRSHGERAAPRAAPPVQLRLSGRAAKAPYPSPTRGEGLRR